MRKPKIGFIGLGLMGAAMVECLQKEGYEITVLGHRDRTGVKAALDRGATEAANAREMTENADIVMICMGTSEQVESRIFGEDGVLSAVSNELVVVDFGTSLPGSTKRIGASIAAKGGSYLDAPLGRTPAHAVNGLLNIMCSGDKAAYDRIKPELDVLGENVFHLGELGSGHTIKLINNFFAMTTACAMSEAFAMADRAGIDRQKVYDVMSAGPLKSGMMDFVKSYAIDGKIDLAFSVANASKDLGYYNIMSEKLGAASLMSVAAANALEAAVEDGKGNIMVPEMVDYFSEVMGQ